MTAYQRIEKVIRHIDAHPDEPHRLEALARVAGLSPFHFHRLFARWAGATPKDFVKFLAGARAKELLRGSRGVLEASLEAGLSGPGRLHDLMVSVEGVTPGEFKARGAGLEIAWGRADSPFGEALIAWTRRGICFLAFDGSPRELAKRWPKAALKRDDRAAAKVLASAFGGKKKIPVVLCGTPFQLKVWEALLRVPRGRVVAYGDVARAVGKPKAARAVGSAIGRNAVAYLIPCHRVIRETGAFGGYRWGAPRKRALLAWEAATS